MATAQDLEVTIAQHQAICQKLKTLLTHQIMRGVELSRERAVRHVAWSATGDCIEAVVQDDRLLKSQVHFVEKEPKDEGALNLSCDCDPTNCNGCAHTAALLVELKSYANVQVKQKRAKSEPLNPKSLHGFVAAKLGRSLPQPAINFLKTADHWWQQRTQFVEKSQLHTLCTRSYYWGQGRVQLFPSNLPPESPQEYLAYLAAACEDLRLTMPAPLPQAIDPELLLSLKTRWARFREIEDWKSRFADWKTESAIDHPPSSELRLILCPGVAVLQAKPPGAASFGKATQKQLKEIGGRSPYSRAAKQLNAGSSIILRSAVDEYGNARSAIIPAMSESLNLCLGQLLSQRHLFDAHVVGEDGEPLAFKDEMLKWQLTPPTEAEGDYTLRLMDSKGESPPPPVAITTSAPLHYITPYEVYPLPSWPFKGDSMEWPVAIPAEAIESQLGVSALGKLEVPVPEKLASRIIRVKAEVQVQCALRRYIDVKSDFLQIGATLDCQGYQASKEWHGFNWEEVPVRAKSKKSADDKLVQVDASIVPAATAWLRQLVLTPVARDSAERLLLEQRCAGKEWPDRFIEWLERRPPGIQLSLDPELASLRDGQVSGRIGLDIAPSKTGMDWFDLTIELKVSDTTLTQAEIDLLLKAKGRWVKLGDKGWRKLNFELSEDQQRELADLGLAVNDFSGEKQRLHAMQLNGLTKKGTTLLPADQARQIKRRVSEIKTRITPDLPTDITATLRPYQLEGFHFLAYLTANRFGGVLADDMGLGKTLQTLAWIAWLRSEQKVTDPILVICPKSVQDNWRSEAARFYPSLRCEVWTRATAGKTGLKGDADLLIIHYPQLRIHEELLSKVHWGAVILDEAQAIKNPTSQSAKAACSLSAQHRLALTGTPIENRLLDLWSIFAFAMPGVLGSRAAFTRDFDGKEDPLARRRLAARTRPFLLRRTKTEVAKDLPDRVEDDLVIEMEGTQAALYQAELKRARAQLLKAETSQQLDKLRFNILTSLLRLRQICCHPRLLGLEPEAAVPVGKKTKKKASAAPPVTVESAKVNALMELLEQLTEEGQKVLVFSQFVEMLSLIEEEIKVRDWHSFKLTGQTEDRGALVKAFQSHEGPSTFLISLKAGGFGLNLTAASYVVLFDPWWNPAVEAQAIDRTHRIGQKQTVFAYRLLIKDSIEEKIRLLQKQKGNLANDILGEENFAQALTLNDFQFLLGEG
jgi:superfamily II DNA or RNA helicase